MPKCLHCGESFAYRFRSNEKFCSTKCCSAYHHKKVRRDRFCEICGKALKGRQQKYCCAECRNKAATLKQMEEMKELAQAKDMETPKVVRKKKKPKYTIAQINEMARAEGLNYGQYVAKYGL